MVVEQEIQKQAKRFSLSDCIDVTPQVKVVEVIKHDKLIQALLKEIKPIDFRMLAFPEVVEMEKELKRLYSKITNADGSTKKDAPLELDEQYKELKHEIAKKQPIHKHYIIYSIEELLKLAIRNNWGICRNNDFYYFYNGAFWSLSNKDELRTFLSHVAEKMGVNKADARFYKFVDDLFKQFHFGANLPEPISDTATTLINLKNGTFEITPTLQHLRKPERVDFLKYQLPFEYNPAVKAPIFQAFLNKVLPDVETQRVLSEYIGYVFIQPNVLKLEKTLFCYGTGANGKSVFFEIIRALLGSENISNYSLQSLTDSTGYYRANLANKLVNYASEINGNLETSVFKQLVSGEPVEARLPYGQPFILSNYAKMIFNGNTLPKDVEHTNAYFRRFLIIPFSVTIPANEQDKDLDKKIIADELPGVFNWVLEGLDRLLKQRNFSKCDAAERMVQDYKQQSDTVALFLDDSNYTPSTTENTPLKSLHSEYKSYCMDNGYKACSNRTLSERLKGIGYDVDRNRAGNVVYLTNKG
jgi:putative DNA primase/helicase